MERKTIDSLIHDIYNQSLVHPQNIKEAEETLNNINCYAYFLWKELKEIEIEKSNMQRDMLETDAELHYAIKWLATFTHLEPEEIDHILSNKL